MVNSVTTTTDYVGGFVYTNNTLSFFSSPEGRVVKNGANFEYQYALADNLGNTRVVFSSVTPTPEAKTATMEAAANTDFNNYTNRVNFNLFDHTDPGLDATDYAQKLTGGNNSQIGVAKSYKVYAGDKVKIEAWAKYQNPTSTGSNINGFANALFTAFGVPAPAGGESGTISSALNLWGGLVVGGNGGSSTGPKAFINIIVFDKNYKLLDAAWEAIDPAAEQVGASPVVPHDYLMREYTAKEEGYVFMYVSNENATLVDVYFDDVVMTHTKSNVVQYNEYYPFGMQTANSWTRENVTGNNFLGNGGTELNTTSNLYDLDYRNYDPILGRMNGVDPMATKYASLSPYNFSFNDPVTFNDPSGADRSQTINYGARNSPWFTSYTYDYRVEYDRGEWFHGGSSSAMSFHFGGRSGGGLINWGNAPSMAQLVSRQLAINFVNGVSSALTSDFGGEVNLLTGGASLYSEFGSMLAGVNYVWRTNSWDQTVMRSAGATWAYYEASQSMLNPDYGSMCACLDQPDFSSYKYSHEFWGVVTGENERMRGARAVTSYHSTYRMDLELRIFFRNDVLMASLSASSFVSAGNLIDAKPWVKAQLLIDGKPTPIKFLSIMPNSIYFKDHQNSYVGSIEWALPQTGMVQLLYEGSWLVGGKYTPTIGSSLNPTIVYIANNITLRK